MSSKYDFPVEAGNKKSVYHRVISWVRPGMRVLDVGCDTGNLGGFLKERGAHVEGLEMDPEAAERARARLDSVHTGSIEDMETVSSLTGPYDCIVFADVLEHLARPEDTLERIKPLLSPSGVVIASLPNVANFRVRLGILSGRFEYTEIGILDRTHLRFFTRNTARRLFADCGYEVLDAVPAATYMPAPLLYGWPELFATRFVIRARPR